MELFSCHGSCGGWVAMLLVKVIFVCFSSQAFAYGPQGSGIVQTAMCIILISLFQQFMARSVYL